MDIVELRRIARTVMAVGSVAILGGLAIMVHGEMNFGDAVLIGGLVSLLGGALLLARTPSGENNVD